jgi:hypothetical protein
MRYAVTSRILPLLTALPLVIAFGVVDGTWSDRWGPSPDLEQAAARIDNVPLRIGDWEGHDRKIDSRQLTRVGIKGFIYRDYVNRRTGAAVEVFLVCGKHGPISVHTPDVCYEGAGYSRKGDITHREVEGRVPAQFWTARFRPVDGAMTSPKRIYWAWTVAGDWQAPQSPRIAFARSAALYKLYVIYNLPRLDEMTANDPSVDFIRQLLPVVHQCLFPGT